MVRINVRSEIRKTRKQRRVPVRGGKYIERIKACPIYTDLEDFIFCGVGSEFHHHI